MSCCSVLALDLRHGQNARHMQFRNGVPFPPTLHGRMIAMTEGAGQRADAATVADDLLRAKHVRDVRYGRTFVKAVEYVRPICDYAYMADGEMIGEKLLALKERAGLPLDEIARRSGYRGKSSIQEYFRDTYSGPLSARAAQKLAEGLSGAGAPPIEPREILALANVGITPNASQPIRYEGSGLERMRRDLPVYGTALGAASVVEGEAIEQTTLNRAEVLEYVERPPMLNGKPGVYALHVQGSSMEPAHDHGDLLIVQKDGAYRAGDDVVVYLRCWEEDDGETADQVLVKRFLRKTAEFYELLQFEPRSTFRIPAVEVLRVDKVLKLRDLLS